jgi:hypothetical protein
LQAPADLLPAQLVDVQCLRPGEAEVGLVADQKDIEPFPTWCGCSGRLDAGRQALLVLAHLRNGDTPARLATGFGIGATTAWRYIREAVDLLAAAAPTLARR